MVLKKILIIEGNGLIRSSLVHQSLSKGYEVLSADEDNVLYSYD